VLVAVVQHPPTAPPHRAGRSGATPSDCAPSPCWSQWCQPLRLRAPRRAGRSGASPSDCVTLDVLNTVVPSPPTAPLSMCCDLIL
jgi:hypothetical protein